MSKISSPYFVEFVGVPGSGKSTLSSRLVKELENKQVLYHEPTYKINQSSLADLRYFYKLPYVVSSAWSEKRMLYKHLQQLENFSQINLKLLFNWFYIKEIKNRFSERKGLTLYDQGLIQALWSFILSESMEKADFFKKHLLKEYLYTDGLVVCVEASADIIRERLRQRTHNYSRVGINKYAAFDISDATRSYKKILKIINKLIASEAGVTKITVKNEEQRDLEINVELIVKEIEDFRS